MANCVLPFLTAGSRQGPDCRRPEILPASMNSPGVPSSVFWSGYKTRGISPPVCDSVRGWIVWLHLVRHARRPRHRHTFVAPFRHINRRNPGSTWLLLTGSGPFELGFQPLTNSRQRFGDVLPRTGHVISGHG